MKFYGYRRADGSVGCRNLVAVIPSVVCAADVAQAIVQNVQGAVGLFHHQGCSQLPPDLKRVTDTLIGLALNPNVGAVLIVSLGCEGTDHARMYQEIQAAGKPVEIIGIQKLGGVSKAIAAGIDAAAGLVRKISGQQREEADLSEVVLSIKCGASDATSGMASNCALGYAADKLVSLGGTVIFGETTEFIGAEHILMRRAVNQEVADRIGFIVNRMETRAKSLGAILKSGTSPIQGVMEYPDRVRTSEGIKKGLWIKDTPGREPEILTGMACSGAQIMMFSTGRGAPQGYPIMPVVKVCSNPVTYQHMEQDMDINAGLILEGKKTIEQVGEEVFAKILETLNGEMSKNESLHYYSAIEIHTLGPVV